MRYCYYKYYMLFLSKREVYWVYRNEFLLYIIHTYKILARNNGPTSIVLFFKSNFVQHIWSSWGKYGITG